MWYWIVAVLLTIYVFWDARRRGNRTWTWALPTVVLWPILVPVYRSRRFLLEGEHRVGGTTWVLLKTFLVVWQILCIAWLVSYAVSIGSSVESTTSEAAAAGTIIGGTIGIGFIFAIWVGVTIIVGVLGLFFRGGKVVEGPTGPNKKSGDELFLGN